MVPVSRPWASGFRLVLLLLGVNDSLFVAEGAILPLPEVVVLGVVCVVHINHIYQQYGCIHGRRIHIIYVLQVVYVCMYENDDDDEESRARHKKGHTTKNNNQGVNRIDETETETETKSYHTAVVSYDKQVYTR